MLQRSAKMQEKYDKFQNFVKSNKNLITFLQQMTESICFSVIFVFLCVIKLLLLPLSNKNLITFGAAARGGAKERLNCYFFS